MSGPYQGSLKLEKKEKCSAITNPGLPKKEWNASHISADTKPILTS
jgi:hypothetical protein